MTRREFLETAAVSTAAATILTADGAAAEGKLPAGEEHGKEGHMDHHNIEEIAQPYLERDGKLFAAIKEAGGWKQFVEQNADRIREDAFYPAGMEKAVACMDEGDDETEVNGKAVHLIRLAGSGILDMDLEDLLENNPLSSAHIEKMADAFIAENITVIQSHGGCGAGGIALEKLWEKKLGRKLTPEEKKLHVAPEAVDELVQTYSEAIVAAMQRKLKAAGKEDDARKVRAHFKPLEQMSRPAAAHIAQVIYYDGTNAFKTSGDMLPAGFLVSARNILSVVSGNRTVDLAKQISFGGHGLGELLTEERPLHIVVIGNPADPEFSEQALLRRANEWKASLPEDMQKRVVIESFTAPLAA
ncbi:MAG: hypothetical protein WCV62_01060 [Candidatus Peribacteraceae bacterium]|jgi:hypothetical protein